MRGIDVPFSDGVDRHSGGHIVETHDETMMTGTPFSRHHLKKVLKPGSRTISTGGAIEG